MDERFQASSCEKNEAGGLARPVVDQILTVDEVCVNVGESRQLLQ
jgi:hypothetical protein